MKSILYNQQFSKRDLAVEIKWFLDQAEKLKLFQFKTADLNLNSEANSIRITVDRISNLRQIVLKIFSSATADHSKQDFFPI